jgi:choline dehydrogenase-like flavoprotein
VRFVDVNELPEPLTCVSTDICIVGSGAAGITLARQLDGSGFRVCLLESGGLGPDEDTQSLYDLAVTGHAVRDHFMSRARYFGGTCNLWAGRSMRLQPLDFEERPWVPHSGWPISYSEIERFYPEAERTLGLPADSDAQGLTNVGRMHPVERQFFGDSDLRPAVASWGRKPMRFGAVYRRQLQASRNIATYLNANLTDIQLNDAGTAVASCRAVSLGGKRLQLEARAYVLACGGLETARLLLANRAVHRSGIGNGRDLVGRFYMDHPRAVFGRVRMNRPVPLNVLLGVPLRKGMAQVGVQSSVDLQRRERLLNGYLTLERHWSEQAAKTYQSVVHSAKIVLRRGYAGRRLSFSRTNLAKVPELIYLLAPRELLPHPVYRVGRMLRQRFSRGVTDLVVVNYCEQAPNPCSRVRLDTAVDRLGMPRLALNWVIGREETATLLRLQALVDARLRRCGLGRLEQPVEFSERLYTDASHHIGTARMSAHPSEGVTDPHGRIHGVDNLFVAGSALFPTAGHANPTLTIVALSIRLAEHLKRTARGAGAR